MKKSLIFLSITILVFVGKINFAQEISGNVLTDVREWWNAQIKVEPQFTEGAKLLPFVKVNGNKFVFADGTVAHFRGLSISDPDKIESQGEWDKQLFVQVKELGASIVRIPVHPIAWRHRKPNEYLELLDQAVKWGTELGLYIVIDWHSIGNLKSGLFQDPMYITSYTETMSFWQTIAKHFAGHNTVAFYELFNEPTTYREELGRITWEEWRKMNEDMIRVIRAFDKETIPLVAGFDWAYDLTPLAYDPVNAEGIGYVSHPYGHKRTPPYEPKWEEDFGFAANQFPVFATEFGFTLGDISMKDNFEYGKAIINYLEGKGISWAWWVYDPQWWLGMIKSWKTHELTDNGKFFKDAADGIIGN
jgi:aryl-phospho-beta-D-glucosidase BglC (GH1 family)